MWEWGDVPLECSRKMCKNPSESTKTSFSITPPFSRPSNSMISFLSQSNLNTLQFSFEDLVSPPKIKAIFCLILTTVNLRKGIGILISSKVIELSLKLYLSIESRIPFSLLYPPKINISFVNLKYFVVYFASC